MTCMHDLPAALSTAAVAVSHAAAAATSAADVAGAASAAAAHPVVVDNNFAQLLNWHSLGLRDTQDYKDCHDQHPASKEQECAPFHAAQKGQEHLANEECEPAA